MNISVSLTWHRMPRRLFMRKSQAFATHGRNSFTPPEKLNLPIHLGLGVYPQFASPESHIDLHNRKRGHIRSFQGRAPCAISKRSPIRRGPAIQGFPPNPRPIKSVSASIASFSSAPLVSMVIVLPTPAASNITATILRALTLRSRTASQTLQLNLEASCAILADGRAGT